MWITMKEHTLEILNTLAVFVIRNFIRSHIWRNMKIFTLGKNHMNVNNAKNDLLSGKNVILNYLLSHGVWRCLVTRAILCILFNYNMILPDTLSHDSFLFPYSFFKNLSLLRITLFAEEFCIIVIFYSLNWASKLLITSLLTQTRRSYFNVLR